MNNMQWVCTWPDICLCSGTDECDCTALHGDTSGVCVHCLERVILVDADTGEPVKHACSPQKKGLQSGGVGKKQ